jgi:hypothetical protein
LRLALKRVRFKDFGLGLGHQDEVLTRLASLSEAHGRLR